MATLQLSHIWSKFQQDDKYSMKCREQGAVVWNENVILCEKLDYRQIADNIKFCRLSWILKLGKNWWFGCQLIASEWPTQPMATQQLIMWTSGSLQLITVYKDTTSPKYFVYLLLGKNCCVNVKVATQLIMYAVEIFKKDNAQSSDLDWGSLWCKCLKLRPQMMALASSWAGRVLAWPLFHGPQLACVHFELDRVKNLSIISSCKHHFLNMTKSNPVILCYLNVTFNCVY